MRKLAAIAAIAFALVVVVSGPAQATPAPAPAAAADDWVRHSGPYPFDWVCVYVGNQVVTQGTWRNYWCRSNGPGYDLWVRAY